MVAFITAQLTTLFRKKRESAQVCAKQFTMQEKSKSGMPPAPPPKSMQPKMHERLSPQLRSEHMPQSCGQLRQSSKPPASSQRMLPQTEQTPQSTGQELQTSGARQRPSPQPMHRPQSSGQLKQLSPVAALHIPSPQVGQAPQSGVQVLQFSP